VAREARTGKSSSYDTYGRPQSLVYRRNALHTTTGGAQVEYDLSYNTLGDIAQVRRPAGPTLWTRNAQDELGRTTSETFSGGVKTVHGYNAFTMRLETIVTTGPDGNGGTKTIQNDSVGYDAVGNVNHRTWFPGSGAVLGETFDHDELNRLHTSQVDGLALKTIAYDAIGVSVSAPHLDADPPSRQLAGVQRCGSSSSIRLFGCICSRSSTSFR
jgi:hypothetical protein